MAERWGLYGLLATERDSNERAMTLEEQRSLGETLIYETDDMDEAQAIYMAGGYTDSDGVWHVVTRVEDRLKGGTVQRPPTRQQPQKPH